jgi:hypothetical protein
MINQNGSNEQEGSPDIRRAKGKATSIGHNELEKDVTNYKQNREFVRRKLHRKNIEGTTHGKAERDCEPTFLAKAENKEEQGPDADERSEGYHVAVKDFRNQIWSSYKGGEGNQG